MARYMLSAHSVDGEHQEQMTDETVRLVVTRSGISKSRALGSVLNRE
jgi:hypothetical protein